MGKFIRHKVIALGFGLWTWSVRARRVLGSLGRPRLRMLDHITLPVRDLDVAREFYCGLLGGAHLMRIDAAALQRFGRPPAERDGDGTYHDSVLLGGVTRIDLFLQREGQPGLTQGHPHVAFRVPPRDMPAWKRRLERAGVPTEGPLQLGYPGQASLYFNDPSGNHLEITCDGYAQDIPIRPPKLDGLAY
jgi:catechol 2,3-dioxygenase-like lactoylglutathione lyase family enzyme